MRYLIVGLLLCVALPVYAESAPRKQVQHMVDGVFAVLNSNLSSADKKQQISGTVQKYLGIKSLSQRTLGIYWRKATKEEITHFMSLYVQILEQTYLNRVDDYSGGEVKYLRERVKGSKAILETKFVGSKVEIPVTYKLVEKTGVWQIYDVVIEGVSLVRTYRSSYNEILRKEGFSELLKRMKDKLVQMKKVG